MKQKKRRERHEESKKNVNGSNKIKNERKN